jgi:uncharacterized protein (DUF2252 family)
MDCRRSAGWEEIKKVKKSQTAPRFKDRGSFLSERRNLKMARSAHAYVRGNTPQFYEWVQLSKMRDIPTGPSIWICGDCHLGNLGPIANAKGEIEIQIRDLDQTVIGNPAFDLIRLGLSLASAARGSDLPGVTTARMLENIMEGYQEAFSKVGKTAAKQIARPVAVRIAMKNALKRKWRDLAKERIKNQKPTIPLGKRFWSLRQKERKEIERVFGNEKIRRLVTSLRSRDDDASVEVQDAAFWVKGCSSLGRLRFAVLLSIGGDEGDLCLIDVKEAVPAVVPAHGKVKMPEGHAERVVAGAWHLSPALGDRMLATHLQGRPVFLRELLPQDLKFEIEYLTEEEATKVAHSLALVVGKAHARQMDEGEKREWLKQLKRNRSKTLDAPSWLWSCVVELAVNHERAYLEHCRRYALNNSN